MTRAIYEYPVWRPPSVTVSQPSRTGINSASARRNEINITAAALGSPIPIAYGLCELAPLIFAVATSGHDLIVGCAWCLGEIEAFVEIYDGDAPINPAWVVQSYRGVPGANVVDPTLAGAIAGYADTLEMTVRGEAVTVAYSVLSIPVNQDFPNLKAVVKGKRSWSGGATFFPEVNVADTANFTEETMSTGATRPAPEMIDGDNTSLTLVSNWMNSTLFYEMRFPVQETFYVLSAQVTMGITYWPTVTYTRREMSFEYWDGGAWQQVPGSFVEQFEPGIFRHSVRLTTPITTDRVRIRFFGGRAQVVFNGQLQYVGGYLRVAEFEAHAKRQSQFAYSSNPAVVLADFCASKAYGLGREVDPTSLQQAVDWCDETMPDGFPRHTVNIALISRSPVEDHVEALRAYANCLVASSGDKVFLIPNRPSAVVGELTETLMVNDTFEPIQQQSTQDLPTVVAVTGTDSSSWPWEEPQEIVYHPEIAVGTIDYRQQTINLPGIHHQGEVKRQAVQRLNYFNLINLHCRCVVFDQGLEWQVGDVLAVSHQWGMDQKPMRIVGMEAVDTARYSLELEEYDPKVYNDTIETVPSFPDTTFGTPDQVPVLAGVAVGQDIVLDIDDDLYPYPLFYRVVISRGGVEVHRADAQGKVIELPALTPGTYDVAVSVRGQWGGTSFAGNTVTVQATI